MKTMYVYIATNQSRTLYTGVTNDLRRRMYEHRTKSIAGFTARYNINELVYFEEIDGQYQAIEREKVLKGWLRVRKVELIELTNPDWRDLCADWD